MILFLTILGITVVYVAVIVYFNLRDVEFGPGVLEDRE